MSFLSSKIDSAGTEPAEIDSKRVNKAIAYGCRLLGSREYSQKSIYQKVMARGYSRTETSQVIDYLLQNGWLSNERFCESFIRSKANRGQGILRIVSDLKRNGINEMMINKALNESDINWQAICDSVCAKKSVMLSSSDKADLRFKLQRFLTYRGFTGTEVQLSLKKYLNIGVSSNEYDD